MAVETADRTDVLEGARNLVRYVEVLRPGQQALIHTEPGFDDPVVVGAVKAALEEAGLSVSVLHTPNWNKSRQAPPRVFEEAIKGCDFLVGQGEYLHTKNHYLQEALFERGLIYINNEAKTVEALGSLYGRFPAELMFAIGTRTLQRCGAGKVARVTTPKGTDITMSLEVNTLGGYCYPYSFDSPGHKKGFPGGTACFHPDDPVNGVIAVEAIAKGNGAPKVVLDSPLFLTVKDHRVASAEGDCADWWREFMSTRGDGNSGWIAECMWGIHPKAQGKGGRAAANPHLLHFGIGSSLAYGGPTFSKTWQVMFTQDATLTIDGDTILDNGHLTVLDEPGIREVAAKYGDPDELLSQAPAIVADQFTGGGSSGG
jgi:2,5-dihydroxypyridine 5,6-dioxygenase